MVIGNRGLPEDMFGFGVVGRAAKLVLVDGLNQQILREQERWSMADEEYEAAGHDVGALEVGIDQVLPHNIFVGPHKSLLESPVDRFPSVSVTAYASRPAPSDPLEDRGDVVEITMLVELSVISGPCPRGQNLLYETIAHRRVERTTEAVLRTIRLSGNLLGTVDSVTQPRGGIVNTSWIKDSKSGHGLRYVLHGSRFQYALTRRMSIYE